MIGSIEAEAEDAYAYIAAQPVGCADVLSPHGKVARINFYRTL